MPALFSRVKRLSKPTLNTAVFLALHALSEAMIAIRSWLLSFPAVHMAMTWHVSLLPGTENPVQAHAQAVTELSCVPVIVQVWSGAIITWSSECHVGAERVLMVWRHCYGAT